MLGKGAKQVMPKILNKTTGEVEELSYDEEGMEKAKEMEKSGEGLVISDARKRSEMTYG